MAQPFAETLREGDQFFMKSGKVHRALDRIARRLRENHIDYAVIGGMALAAHGYERFTSDVDLLTTPAGLEAIHANLVGRGYVPSFPGARKSLRDTENGVTIEFITSGEFPGDGKPKAVVFPDPRLASVEVDGYSVIAVAKLVELKLASGLTAPHRMRDLADVQDLITA
jgi:hypothetical protein